MEPECPFCSIVDGVDHDVEILFRTDDWLAFFPTSPATPGHTLVIPVAHVADLWEAGPLLGGKLGEAVVRVGRAIAAALSPDGMNVISSAGHAAEQSVFHAHLHVVPRWTEDPIGPIWPPKRSMDDELESDLADRIRSELNASL